MTDTAKLDLILEKMVRIDEKVSGLQENVFGLHEEVSGLHGEVSGLHGEVSGLREEVFELREKVSSLDERVSNLDKRVSSLEIDLKDVKQKVTKLNMIVENEIRVNIQRVAEGHLDLYRNLKDCISLSREVKARQEMQDIYINIHDTKLKALAL